MSEVTLNDAELGEGVVYPSQNCLRRCTCPIISVWLASSLKSNLSKANYGMLGHHICSGQSSLAVKCGVAAPPDYECA
jgi:hypothetical protein